MDQEFSDELTGLMPVVPHGISGVDCSGRIIAAVEGNDVELRCNECGAVVGVVQINGAERESDGWAILGGFLNRVNGNEFDVGHRHPLGLQEQVAEI